MSESQFIEMATAIRNIRKRLDETLSIDQIMEVIISELGEMTRRADDGHNPETLRFIVGMEVTNGRG